MSARAAAGQPLVKSGDVLGFVLKSTPGPGTATGAGGYMTFYVPAGTQVVGVEYVREDPAQPGTYIPYPLPGPAVMPIGSGPIGQTCPAAPPNLQGTTLGPNVLGVASAPVAAGTGCHRGTLAGVYGDIGIYYSTDPRTAYGTWTGGPLTNNRGVTSVPTTKWDAFQLWPTASSRRACRSSTRPTAAAMRPGDSPGSSPGPRAATRAVRQGRLRRESGAAGVGVPDGRPLGPGQVSGQPDRKDQPGLVSSALGYAGVDATRSAARPPGSSSTARTRCRSAPRRSGSPTVVSSSGVPRWSG